MTTGAIITFDQMERRADRTFALVLYVKHAHRIAKGVMLITVVSWALKSLVRSLCPEKLDSLSQKQAIELTKRLQETHQLLAQLCRATDRIQLNKHAIFGRSIRALEESTEDLGDIIEDLILSESGQFKQLVMDCAETLSRPAGAGTLARM